MLAHRLLIAFLAVILPSTVVLGGVTIHSIFTLDDLNHRLVEITQSREAVADLHGTLSQLGAPLVAYVLDRDPTQRQWFERLLTDVERQLLSCGAARCHLSTTKPEAMIERLRPALDRIRTEGREIFEVDGRRGATLAQQVHEVATGLRQATDPMLAAGRVGWHQLERGVEEVEWRALWLAGALTIAVLLAGSAAALLLARRISRPLSDLVHGTRRVRAGDWAYRAAVRDRGEIGELAASFNTMVDEIGVQRAQLEEQNRTLEARVERRTEELRRKEEALLQSEKLASLGLLAAGVAHELNNPLTSIMMNANLAGEGLDEGSPVVKDLKKIDADARRCRRIIEDLRVFARLRELDKAAGAVEAVVEEAVALCAHEVGSRRVAVTRDLAPDLPPVTWDADRMVQVLSNLLVNSAQAIGDGGHIVVRGRRADGWLTLEVEDDGPGIPAAHLTRVFDPFFTTKADGTGLGLSISHGIVNEHGGRIEVESRTREEGGAAAGTTVRVILPIREARG